MKQEKDFHKKELELLRTINGGGLSLNNSCYKWLYAYFKTQEHFKKSDVNYDLYSLTEYKHPIYFIGEPISKGIRYVKIEEKELNNNYMLIYQSKICYLLMFMIIPLGKVGKRRLIVIIFLEKELLN